jgi:Ni/Co efflux regulator RcnB
MIIKTLTAFSFIFVLILAQPALAKNNQAKNKHAQTSAEKESGATVDIINQTIKTVVDAINPKDRETIKVYLGKQNRKHCPPGLAKKNNGCMPPGLSKKYGIGKKLPDDTWAKDLPSSLRDLLQPPKGYVFKQVDQDIVLMSSATRKIVDAVTLLSSIGN